ncbi:MAG: HPr family phosphocarrier protein [Candidatus Omnitrophica bacterium]|nr:HPr family phosphocarrier protein [Candidatus Omnitrophota bacterium]
MKTTKVKVNNPYGLHLRPSAKVVNAARSLKSKITLTFNKKTADSASILEIIALGATSGAEIEILAEGSDENAAVQLFTEMFRDGAGI